MVDYYSKYARSFSPHSRLPGIARSSRCRMYLASSHHGRVLVNVGSLGLQQVDTDTTRASEQDKSNRLANSYSRMHGAITHGRNTSFVAEGNGRLDWPVRITWQCSALRVRHDLGG
jgi:hypothetical protein